MAKALMALIAVAVFAATAQAETSECDEQRTSLDIWKGKFFTEETDISKPKWQAGLELGITRLELIEYLCCGLESPEKNLYDKLKEINANVKTYVANKKRNEETEAALVKLWGREKFEREYKKVKTKLANETMEDCVARVVKREIAERPMQSYKKQSAVVLSECGNKASSR